MNWHHANEKPDIESMGRAYPVVQDTDPGTNKKFYYLDTDFYWSSCDETWVCCDDLEHTIDELDGLRVIGWIYAKDIFHDFEAWFLSRK